MNLDRRIFLRDEQRVYRVTDRSDWPTPEDEDESNYSGCLPLFATCCVFWVGVIFYCCS